MFFVADVTIPQAPENSPRSDPCKETKNLEVNASVDKNQDSLTQMEHELRRLDQLDPNGDNPIEMREDEIDDLLALIEN